MTTRSRFNYPWRCCGADLAASIIYCPYCGGQSMIADTVLIRLPISEGADVAVVANGTMSVKNWRRLADVTELTARSFERCEAMRAGGNHCGPQTEHPVAEAAEGSTLARADATAIVREEGSCDQPPSRPRASALDATR